MTASVGIHPITPRSSTPATPTAPPLIQPISSPLVRARSTSFFVYRSGRSILAIGLQPSAGGEVRGEAAEPMPALVVLARHGGESTGGMRARRGQQGAPARIAGRQSRRDSLQHPCPAEIETIQMRQLAIRLVGHDADRQPRG